MATREQIEKIKRLRLLDDNLMTVVFNENIEATQYILRIILGQDDLVVTESKAQKPYSYLGERGIRLDVFAKDNSGKIYDIEIQRSDDGAGSRRARYNSSKLETKLLEPSANFKDLVDTYVIFITENDIYKRGFPMYHIERQILETNEPFDDGAHIIYVNGAYQGDDAIGLLMHDFRCESSVDMNESILRESVKNAKETEKGVANMCRLFEDYGNEQRKLGLSEGIAEGMAKGKTSIAKNLIKRGYSTDEISAITELPLSEIEKLIKEIKQT